MRKVIWIGLFFLVFLLSGCSKSSLTYDGNRYVLTSDQNTYQFENQFIYKNVSQNYTHFTFSFTDTVVDFVNNSEIYVVTYTNGSVYQCTRLTCVKTEGSGEASELPISFRSLVPLEHTGSESGLASVRITFIIMGGVMMAFGIPFAWSNDNARGLIVFRSRISFLYKRDVDPSMFGIVLTRISAGLLALLGLCFIVITFMI